MSLPHDLLNSLNSLDSNVNSVLTGSTPAPLDPLTSGGSIVPASSSLTGPIGYGGSGSPTATQSTGPTWYQTIANWYSGLIGSTPLGQIYNPGTQVQNAANAIAGGNPLTVSNILGMPFQTFLWYMLFAVLLLLGFLGLVLEPEDVQQAVQEGGKALAE